MLNTSSDSSGLKTIVAFSVRCLRRLRIFLVMASYDNEMPDLNEDEQLLETFKQMNQYLPHLLPANDDAEQTHKKPKRTLQTAPPVQNKDKQLVPLLAQLVVRLDMENQTLRRQDCFIFYMQTQKEAILPTLLTTAKDWHNNLANRSEEEKLKSPYLPLRVALAQTLANNLSCRLKKLAQSTPKDPLWQTAVQHGLLNDQGHWSFRRWNVQTQALVNTPQTPIPMDRMLRYIDQLKELVTTQGAIMKFHSLKPNGTGASIPWLLQTGVRQDELQTLLEVLTGNNIWGLLGASNLTP